jgi:peroxiredoxin
MAKDPVSGMRVIVFSFLLLFLVPCAMGMGNVPLPGGGVEVGKPAIDFTLADLAGKKITLSDYKGKVVLLNFWATWCPYCVEEMPSLQLLYDRYKGKKFELLAVSVGEELSDVKKFAEKGGYQFKILLDKDKNVGRQYRAFSLPLTYIIDKKGIVVDKIIGSRDWMRDPVVKTIERLLQK